MADDTSLNPGSGGDTIVTDSLGGDPERKVQAVKLMLGASGVEGALVDGSNPLPVTMTLGAGDNNIGNVDVVTLPALVAGSAEIGRVRITDGTDLALVTAAGALSVEAAGTLADEAAFTEGASLVMPAGFLFTNSPSAPDAGDIAAAKIDSKRAQVFAIEDSGSDNRASVSAGGALLVDVNGSTLPTGAATSANQTTEITALQLLDDIVHATNGAIGKAAAIGGHFDDSGTTEATEGNVAPVRITAQRAFHANLRNVAGTEIGTAGAPVRTDPTGTTTQPVTVATALPAGDNNIGNVDVVTLPALPAGANEIGRVRITDGTDLALVSAAGALLVDASATTQPVSGTVTAAQATASSLNAQVQGPAATGAAVSGNPLLSGNRGDSATPSAVDAGDAVPNWADLNGRQVSLIGGPNALTTRGLLNRTDNSAADVIAAAGAGVKVAVMGFAVVNGHATVGTKVSLRDGTTAKVTFYAAPAGGGASASGSSPIFTTTANTAVTAICATTGADVDVNVWGYLTP